MGYQTHEGIAIKMSFDTFFAAYLECAVWSSTDYPAEHRDPNTGDPLVDNPTPLDDLGYDASSIQADDLAKLKAEALEFYNANRKQWDDDAQAGHDFWLTRNHHGAGFWDGDYPADVGRKLTDAAHAFGSCDLYIVSNGVLGVE